MRIAHVPRLPVLAVLVMPSGGIAAQAQEDPFQLVLPIACDVGSTCLVQHLVDRDPGPGVRDYTCGTLTNDGHNGVDFRLPSLAAMRGGVDVLAAADGTVAAVRDAMPDRSVRETGPAAVAGTECGNGVRITHNDGWETQYCHMAEGSVRVSPGQTVAAGEGIGRVGLSGQTEFPHLHFTVRRGGEVTDPFSTDGGYHLCDQGQSIWAPDVLAQLGYRAPAILNTGFADRPVAMEAIEAGITGLQQPTPASPALVAFARAIGLAAGDVERLVIRSPEGAILVEDTSAPLERSKAQMMKFVGKRRPTDGFPKGTYTATYSIMRQGRVVTEQAFRVTL